MTVGLKYDDLVLDDFLSTWRFAMGSRIDAQLVPRRHGALIHAGVVEEPRVLEISGTLVDQTSPENLRTTLDTWSETFARRNKKLYMFTDRYIQAYKTSFNIDYIPGGSLKALDFAIVLLCADPFWYDINETVNTYTLTSADTVVDITNARYKESNVLNNTGNAFSYPIVEVTAGASSLTECTFRNVTTGRLWTYSGTVAPNKTLKVDANLFLVQNDGAEDLTNWSGDFVWLDKGNNTIEVQGSVPSTWKLTYRARWF